VRQLREITGPPFTVSAASGEKIDVRPRGESPILLFGLMFFAAVAAGYAALRLVHPASYVLVGVMAVGGASAAFLAFAIPVQTMLFVRKLLIRAGLNAKRRRFRHVLHTAHAELQDAVGDSPEPTVVGDLAIVDYLRGATDWAQERLDGAAASSDPGLANNLGVIAAESGDYDNAAELFVRSARDGSCPEASINLALAVPLVNSPGPVEELASSRPEELPLMAVNSIGVYYLRQGMAQQATEWLSRAARLQPRHAHSWANLGLVAYRHGRLHEAAGHLIKAARIAPSDARIVNNLAVMLAAAGKRAWSRRQLQRASALEPGNIGIRINSLALSALSGHTEHAMRGLTALSTTPHHRGDACYNLAVMQLWAGDIEAAAQNAAEAVEEGGKSADVFTNLAFCLWYLGRHSDALVRFRAATQAFDATAGATSNLARALLLEGETEEALRALEAGREKWRGDAALALDMATSLLAKALLHYRRDMTPSERGTFFTELHRSHAGLENATRKPGAPPEAYLNIGLYLYVREEFVPAAEQFELAAQALPGEAALRHLAGTAYGRAADACRHMLEDGRRSLTSEGLQLARKAVPHLVAASEDRDSGPNTFYNAGRVLYALEDCERALAMFRKGLRLEDSEEMNALAALAAAKQAREWQDAIKTQSLMPETKRDVLRKNARLFMDSAVQYFRQALRHNELNATLHGNMGLAYMLRNRDRDVESALRHWQRMRAIAGGISDRRYTQFAEIQSAEHASRVQFDDSEVACRDIDVVACMATPPPEAAGLRYVLEPVSDDREWRLVAHNGRLGEALRLRDRIWEAERTLARLGA